MFYRISWFICWLICKIVFRLEISGRENIPKKEAVMIVANHTSFLDPVIIGVSSPRILTYLAREDLFEIPFFRRLLWALGNIPISRRKLEFSLLNKISKLAEQKKAFVIFPEGTRSKTGRIGSGKAGVGLIAWRARVKIIPTLILGTDKALPVKAKFIRLAKIKIIFGQALNLSSFYQREPSRELYQEIVNRMIESIKQLET